MGKIISAIKFVCISAIVFFILMFIIALNIEGALLGGILSAFALALSIYISIRLTWPKRNANIEGKKPTKSIDAVSHKIGQSEIQSNSTNDGLVQTILYDCEDVKIADFVAFDLETTGLNPTRNEIIEIGAVKVKDGKVEDIFQTLIHPKLPIPSDATRINGITNAMVKYSPTIDTVLPKFIDFISDLPLIAHNASFDEKFIRANAFSLNIDISNSFIDTLKLSRKHYPYLSSHKLATVKKHLNIATNKSHRGLDDSIAAAKIYIACCKIEANIK